MSNATQNTLSAASKQTQSDSGYSGFGRGHQDIDDDLAALKSVMGIPAFSSGLKQLKNSFAGLKSLFIG
jgi:hypothetical protein